MDRFREYIEKRLGIWTEMLRDLVRIPSTYGEEKAVVRRVEEILGELRCPKERIHLVPHGEGRNSLVVRYPGRGHGRSLILNAHLDIVPAGDDTLWNHPPFKAFVDREKNCLHGRGAMDDKAGVVVALATLDTLLNNGVSLGGDLTLQLVLEDESTSHGSLRCLNAGFRADAAMIIDGTRLEKAIDTHAGQLQFTIEAVSDAVSVSVSHLGKNPAELLARFAGEVKQKILSLNEGRAEPWRRFPSPYQCSLQAFRSQNDALYSIPSRAEADFYVTFCPLHSLADVKAMIVDRVEAWQAEVGFLRPPEVRWKFCCEPCQQPAAQPLAKALQETARLLGRPDIEIGPSTGTSDMRHFLNEGIPCLLYGPGNGGNPHRVNEYYYLEDLPKAVEFYAVFAQKWCSWAPS